MDAIFCMAKCDESDAECAFECSMLALDNQPFLDISQCMADIGCLPEYPDDGICLAEDSQALQVFHITWLFACSQYICCDSLFRI